MKIVDKVVRFLVGGLFIFSGLIKVNDPKGTAIKLEEYFEVFATDFGSFFHAFVPYALELAVFIVVLETVLGVAVLINYRPKITYWILLLLILFFTFLTFYSAYYDKVSDCGCFGDAIPLTPWESFSKDIILLILVGYLFIRRGQQQPALSGSSGNIAILASTAACIFLAIFALRHLPYIDFRPYAPGKNIEEQMSPSATLDYDYIMKKDGETKKFEEYPSDTSWKFVDMPLQNPGALPKITDYNIWKKDEDYTDESLSGKKLVVVVHDASNADAEAFQKIAKLSRSVSEVTPVVFTSSASQEIEKLLQESDFPGTYYFADATLLKAMIRSNPGVLLMKDGTVVDKWHYNDVPQREEIENQLK